MIRDEILEYPYQGTITRVVQGKGKEKDSEVLLYEGVMDEHMVTDEEGRMLQTASYIVSMPLTKDDKGNWIMPRKGDKVSVTRYGDTISLNIGNTTPFRKFCPGVSMTSFNLYVPLELAGSILLGLGSTVPYRWSGVAGL